jgi:hypothetical protein
VSENVGLLLTIIGVVALFGAVAAWCVFGAIYCEWHEYGRKEGKPPSPWFPAALTPIFVVLWVLAAMCPSKTTIYGIAASQMGEQALKTPLAGKAGKALEAWLDKQIAENEPKKAEAS